MADYGSINGGDILEMAQVRVAMRVDMRIMRICNFHLKNIIL
jgi:hypothetical protein